MLWVMSYTTLGEQAKLTQPWFLKGTKVRAGIPSSSLKDLDKSNALRRVKEPCKLESLR